MGNDLGFRVYRDSRSFDPWGSNSDDSEKKELKREISSKKKEIEQMKSQIRESIGISSEDWQMYQDSESNIELIKELQSTISNLKADSKLENEKHKALVDELKETIIKTTIHQKLIDQDGLFIVCRQKDEIDLVKIPIDISKYKEKEDELINVITENCIRTIALGEK